MRRQTWVCRSYCLPRTSGSSAPHMALFPFGDRHDRPHLNLAFKSPSTSTSFFFVSSKNIARLAPRPLRSSASKLAIRRPPLAASGALHGLWQVQNLGQIDLPTNSPESQDLGLSEGLAASRARHHSSGGPDKYQTGSERDLCSEPNRYIPVD